jgi:hypothetical protein
MALQELTMKRRNPIDYERSKREHPRLKAMLTRAGKDPVKVKAACLAALKAWDGWGAWPDNWSAWQRALDDSMPYPKQAPRLDQLQFDSNPSRRKKNPEKKLIASWKHARGDDFCKLYSFGDGSYSYSFKNGGGILYAPSDANAISQIEKQLWRFGKDAYKTPLKRENPKPGASKRVHCPKCDPANPDLDEDGKPYTCYFCSDTGYLTRAEYAEYLREERKNRRVMGPARRSVEEGGDDYYENPSRDSEPRTKVFVRFMDGTTRTTTVVGDYLGRSMSPNIARQLELKFRKKPDVWKVIGIASRSNPIGSTKPRPVLRRTDNFLAVKEGGSVRIMALGGGVAPKSKLVSDKVWRQLADLSDREFDNSVVLEVGVGTYMARRNPSLGPVIPHTWIAPGGVHVCGGDTVEYWTVEGLARGAKAVKRKAKVNRMLIFDDHVQVNHGSFGNGVYASNFIRVVRKA